MIQPLFGLPSRPWPTFRPINDQVRGGSSTSAFTPSPLTQTAIFDGHLDTKTLGGAGFASQCATFHPRLSFPSPPSRGLALTLVRPASFPSGQPTSFVISLKNERPELREDGRRESVMSYEWQFDLRELPEGIVEIEAAWKDFKPTYRGREDKEAADFDPKSLYEYAAGLRGLVGWRLNPPPRNRLSFMCRSNFDTQSGDFKLEIVSLGIVTGPASTTAWGGWAAAGWQYLTGVWTSWARWWRGDRGLRLPD
ncbi:hypothetical protein RQP46_000450 [Phenoliferia psychrophenolica]